jgi:hypothetical protein
MNNKFFIAEPKKTGQMHFWSDTKKLYFISALQLAAD